MDELERERSIKEWDNTKLQRIPESPRPGAQDRVGAIDLLMQCDGMQSKQDVMRIYTCLEGSRERWKGGREVHSTYSNV